MFQHLVFSLHNSHSIRYVSKCKIYLIWGLWFLSAGLSAWVSAKKHCLSFIYYDCSPWYTVIFSTCSERRSTQSPTIHQVELLKLNCSFQALRISIDIHCLLFEQLLHYLSFNDQFCLRSSQWSTINNKIKQQNHNTQRVLIRGKWQ